MQFKYIITTFLLLCGMMVSNATANPRARAKFENLNLSDAQKVQLQNLRESRRQQMQSWRERGERPSQEQREAFKAQFHTDLSSFLTAEQLAQFEELRGQRPKWGRHGRGSRKNGLGRMLKGAGLDLTAAQQEQIKALHQAQRVQRQGQRESGERLSKEARQAVRQELRAQVEAVLTAEQLEQFEQFRAQRPERGKHGRGGRKNGLGRMLKGAGLDLTAVQQEQVKALHQAQRVQRQAQRESGERLSKEAMQAVRQELRAQVEAILTAEQLEQLAAHRANHQKDVTNSTSSSLQLKPNGAVPATAVEKKTWGEIKQDLNQ